MIVGLLCNGCDQLPWLSKPKSDNKQTVKSAPDAHATPVVPSLSPAVPLQDRVAVVNGTMLSTQDLELAVQELKRLTQLYQQEWKPLSAEENPNALDLHDVLTNLTDSELKAQDARARGLDRKTDAQRRLAYLQRGFLSQEWETVQREHALPTEEEIHKFYEENKLGFIEPERIQVSQIVASSLAEAEGVRSKAVQGAVFAQLAAESSVGPGKEAGGDIGWHLKALDHERLRLIGAAPTEKIFFPQLEAVAFSLEDKQISQPVRGPDGRYYVVQLTQRKPAEQKTQLQVRDMIAELLTRQQIQDQLAQLRKKAKLEEFPEHLSGVEQ